MKNVVAIALLALLNACASTGTPNRPVGLRRDPVDGVIARYQSQLASGDGNDAVAALNGYFEVVRTTCNLNDEACAQVCGRRAEIRRLMGGWNNVHSHTFARNGFRIEMTWDADINPTCDSH